MTIKRKSSSLRPLYFRFNRYLGYQRVGVNMLRSSRPQWSSVASRIAERLNPAIETAVDPRTRFRTKFEAYSFSHLAKIVSVPIGIAFGLNLWSYVSGSNKSTFFGWRVLAHLGPYHIPRLVESGEWRRSLETLGRAIELELLESEIAQLLTDIEVVSQRRIAVRRIVKDYGGMKIFTPIFSNLASPPPPGTNRKGQSHFEANLRVALDVVSATAAVDRELPVDVIERILTNNSECWESDSNEEARRFREYRCVLLLKLLQNDRNRMAAKQSRIIREFISKEQPAASHQAYPALPFMPLLYQFKTEKLGFEHSDIVRKLESMLEIESGNENNIPRKSLKLEYKVDFLNFEKLAYLTICYASLRVVPMISEYSWQVVSRAMALVGRSVLGASLLETWYRGQEHVIQSAPWYDAKNKFVASGYMAVTNVVFGAIILRYFPFCGVPWLLMRARDSFSDSFRFL